MKKMFTLLSALLVSVLVMAGAPQSRLTISSLSNKILRVVIDGRTVTDRNRNDQTIAVDNLNSGYHSIKIYELRQRQRWGRGNDYGYGSDNNYTLTSIYDGRFFVRNNYHIDIVVNRFGKVFVDEQFVNGNWNNDRDDDDDHGYGNGGWNNGNNGGWNNNGYSNNMNASSFEQFKQTLRNESYDNSRVNQAKQVMAMNYFSAAQIKELVSLFTYESNKLDVAKAAYSRCTDKGNYFVVNDAFTYSSTKDELVRYIRTQS